MRKYSKNFNSYYCGALQCKESMFSEHGKCLNFKKFKLQSIIYMITLIIKLIVSRVMPSPKLNNTIAFSWISYTSRFYDYQDSISILNYHYKKFSFKQISIFRFLSIRDLIEVKKNFSNIDKTVFQQGCDNRYYRFINMMEFCLVLGILRQGTIRHIVIAGINDRLTIYVCEIANLLNIKTTILQHGAFTRFPNNFLTITDEFCYLYDFSIPYLKYFLRETSKIKLTYLPQKKSKKIFSTPSEFKAFVTFATTPSNIELNKTLIKLIRKNLSTDCKLIINPHPREKLISYEGINNVIVTREKYVGALAFITRISTIGVEMSEEGENVCFVNTENHRTDFIDSGKYQVFSTLVELENFLVNLKT